MLHCQILYSNCRLKRIFKKIMARFQYFSHATVDNWHTCLLDLTDNCFQCTLFDFANKPSFAVFRKFVTRRRWTTPNSKNSQLGHLKQSWTTVYRLKSLCSHFKCFCNDLAMKLDHFGRQNPYNIYKLESRLKSLKVLCISQDVVRESHWYIFELDLANCNGVIIL